MANSRDPRRHLWHQRGSKRYGDVGGHSPPNDTIENTRDHERIWFELRRHKNCCCDPNDPGFRYCTGPKADYPTLICDEYLLPAGALIDFFSGGGNNDGVASSWYLNAGCGSNAKAYSEPFGSATFYPDGSWRNGPFVTGMSKPGLFQSTDTHWDGTNWLPNKEWTFEYWIKPSPTDIALAKQLTGSGPFMALNDGGLFTSLNADGSISFTHETVAEGARQYSAAGVVTADQWHHIVYVRRLTNGGSFSIYVNGVRVVYSPLATDFPVSSSLLMSWGTGASNSQWADIARYRNAISAAAIFRHYRALADDYGLTPPVGDEPQDDPTGGGGGVSDPGDYIFDLPPDRIAGEDKEGYILASDGDTGYWQSPEDSPFELEERKDQASGYPSLDASTLVPMAEMGTEGVGDGHRYLRDDRVWFEGTVVPEPDSIDQMLQAGPNASTDYAAAVASVFSGATYKYWPLTEAALPFEAQDGSDFIGEFVAPSIVDTEPYCFFGESRPSFSDTDDLKFPGSGGTLFDASKLTFAFWIKLDEIPASTVRLIRVGGDVLNVNLLSTGLIELAVQGVVKCTSVTALDVGEWRFVVVSNDGDSQSGAGSTGSRIWIDGVLDASGSGAFGTPYDFGGFSLGGDGFHGEIAHFSYSNMQAAESLTDAEVLSLYQARHPVWYAVPEIAGGSGGVDASENDTPVTAAPRSRVNFIPGTNITVDVVDDSANDEIDVTITATSPAGSGIEVSDNDVDVSASPRGRLNFLDGTGTTVVTSDDGVNDEVEIQVDVDVPLPDPSAETDGDVLTIASGAWTVATPAAGGGGVEASENDVDITAAARGRINVLDGTGTTANVVDDAVNDEVEVSIDVDHPLPDPSAEVDGQVLTTSSGAPIWAAPAGGGGGSGVEVDLNDVDQTAAARGRLNFIEGSGIDITVSDDVANDEVDITIAATGGGGGGSSELDYTEITADVNITASTEATADTIITAGAVALDGLTTIEVEFFCPGLDGVADQGNRIVLFDAVDGGAAAAIGVLAHPRVQAAGSANSQGYYQVYGRCRITPASGSHVFSVRGFFSEGGGTAIVRAGSGGAGAYFPAFVKIVSV